MIEHQGGCHCGAVKFIVSAPAKVEITDCNCSICGKSGYLHLIVPADRFKLLQGEGALTTYVFNTHTAQHKFCKICGIKSFYIPRSHPDGYSVNFRCVEKDHFEEIDIKSVNGKEWEKQYPEGRAEYNE